ncbi:PDZ domain-containing protein [Aporhodopirellula aestuarii]|uniref:Right-handed parallel beta-helix repeat-containing protein n=1 Tax=Aporhodopirellula aestuarii TaxID=2950107 RepID=A0ABT0UAN7_9BACT|nr:PDZ domain-containing protein [Aporhodopirellula aestuarii]MCM2373448.1 right-handed parallel beta-helix repeat-containing protein [Aporhodopirellula aestuarii]
MNPMKIFVAPFVLICVSLGVVSAADIYVSPAGSDNNPGTQVAPVVSLEKAKSLAQPLAGKESVTVHVADGVYYLPTTLVFTPDDSGTAEYPVVFAAINEGGAVLSGGSQLDLDWKPFRDGVFMAKTQSGLEIDQLFVNGTNQRMARYPNYDASKKTAAYQGFAADAFSKERAAGWADPTGGFIHAMHKSRWGGYHYQITGKSDDGEVTYEGGWQNNRPSGMHRDFRMVENIFEELDAPGEWYHDSDENTLYYKPDGDVDLTSAIVEVVRLRHLIEFQGSESAPVKFVTLKGFVVRHAARTFMDTKEPLLRSDWAIYRGGSIFLTGTEDVQILDAEFDQVGGNAVFFSNYNRRALVKGCHIHDVGASGVCFVGDPDAVRDPLFGYGQKNDLTKIDRTPGPKTNNYPSDSVVADCLIHGIGRVERQPAGVLIEMASRITVRDCSIYDCARAGINIGDGAWGGHLIERCDVFDTVQETHDHGSFNSWGRDRYWRSDRSASQDAVDKDPNLPFLDAVETTVIRNSRWRCDHGWDIDLDDGSSNYDIYNNLMLAGGLKLREGFRRHAWNNITVNNGFHPHVWYNDSGDEVHSNIFMAASRGARMPTEEAKGKRVDGNLFYSPDPNAKDRYAKFGWEANSVVGDPLFVDPANGDFRVREGSPALQVGFENFPMDQFGVKKPSLKAIAETPVIPPLITETAERPSQSQPMTATDIPVYWLGAKIHSLSGEEFSAFGVRKEDGGVALSQVGDDTAAANAGLQESDLIQAVNGKSVKDVPQFLAAYCSAGDAPLTLKVIRDQEPMKLEVASGAYVAVESIGRGDQFSTLAPPSSRDGVVSSSEPTNNSPLSVLVDGQLVDGYGPVFGNGVYLGVYRMDLGSSKAVSAITSWSANHNGNRGAQKLTIYGSNSERNPGWDLSDRKRFAPLGTIDTTSLKGNAFNAASLRARSGESLGTFRWICWQTVPVTDKAENTAFQELAVQ